MKPEPIRIKIYATRTRLTKLTWHVITKASESRLYSKSNPTKQNGKLGFVTSCSSHLILKLLLFFHHHQQLDGRIHKGHQRIALHQHQSHPAVIIYQWWESKQNAGSKLVYLRHGGGKIKLSTATDHIVQSYTYQLESMYTTTHWLFFCIKNKYKSLTTCSEHQTTIPSHKHQFQTSAWMMISLSVPNMVILHHHV